MNVLTVWLAVDHSDRENGCMRVIRGSHKQELTALKDDFTVANALGSYTHRDEDIDQSQIVDIVLKPGGMYYQPIFYLCFPMDDFVYRHQHTSSKYNSWF